ncbi:MAG: glycosyltransferase [Legionellaceae bacterium]|nr:glycosyltransferase [Legionellaceae bacterium]
MTYQSSNRRGNELLQRAVELDEYDITIFVPCRNEEKNVGHALNEIVTVLATYSFTYEIIVIDDASKDGSVAKIKQFQLLHPNINIILKQNKRPLGVSYNFADAALLGRGRYFRMIGGHFQDREEALRNGFDHLGKADIILTYIKPDYRKPIRQHLSRTYTKLVNFISGYDIAHYHGTPMHRRIDVIRWHSYRSVGFYADITTRLLDEGVTYLEIPTTAYERETGKSLALRWRNVISLFVGFADMFLRRFSKERIPSVRVILEEEINAQ